MWNHAATMKGDLRKMERRMAALEARLRQVENELANPQTATPAPPAPAPPPTSAPPPPEPPKPPPLAGRTTEGPAASATVPPSQPAPPPPAPPRPPPPPGFDWTGFLRNVYLLPPETEDNLEAQLGAWWATRIGGMLAVIALIFLGVYVSQFASPLVRFLQLAAVSAIITGLGLFLERRTPQFGRVVTAAGLATGFFTCFAAHSVPAMRIVESQTLGALLQLAGAVGIFAVAAWKDSRNIAVLAVVFAGLGQGFLLYEQGGAVALPALWSLSLLAAGLLAVKRWIAPAFCAAGILLLLSGVHCFALRPPGGFPAWWTMVLGLGLHMAALQCADLWAWRGRADKPVDLRRLFQTLHLGGASSLAVLVAWIVHNKVDGLDRIDTTAYLFGGLLLALAGLCHLCRDADQVTMPMVKGAALIALGIVVGMDGYGRWMGLLLQATVLLLPAVRSRYRWMTILPLAAWGIAATTFFLHEEIAGLGTGLAWMRIAFVVASALLLAGTWRYAHRLDDQQPWWCGVALGVVLIAASLMTAESAWIIPFACALGLVCAAAGWRWSPATVSGMVIPVSVYLVLRFVVVGSGPPAAQTLSATCLLALLLATYLRIPYRLEWNTPVAITMIVVWQVLVFRLFAFDWQLVVSAVTAWTVLRIGLGFGRREIADLAALPLWLGTALAWWSSDVAAASVPVLVVTAAGAALAWAAAGWAAMRVPRQWLPASARDWVMSIPCGAMTLLACAVADEEFVDATTIIFLCASMGVWAYVWMRLRPAAYLSVVFLWFGCVSFAVEGQPVFEACCVAAVCLLHLWSLGRAPSMVARQAWRSLVAVTLLATMFHFFLRPDLAAITTIGWGATALLVVVCGFVLKAVELRAIGFVGLGLAIVRLFAVDIQDTLYRIIAFGVLAVTFLGIGGLYTVFRDRVSGR